MRQVGFFEFFEKVLIGVQKVGVDGTKGAYFWGVSVVLFLVFFWCFFCHRAQRSQSFIWKKRGVLATDFHRFSFDGITGFAGLDLP